MTKQQLIETSPQIVTAVLIGAERVSLSADTSPYRLGVLKVSKQYKGSPHEILFIHLPLQSMPKKSTSIDYPIGQTGIWFLRQDNATEGIFYADNPQRLWPLDRSTELLKLLQQL